MFHPIQQKPYNFKRSIIPGISYIDIYCASVNHCRFAADASTLSSNSRLIGKFLDLSAQG